MLSPGGYSQGLSSTARALSSGRAYHAHPSDEHGVIGTLAPAERDALAAAWWSSTAFIVESHAEDAKAEFEVVLAQSRNVEIATAPPDARTLEAMQIES